MVAFTKRPEQSTFASIIRRAKQTMLLMGMALESGKFLGSAQTRELFEKSSTKTFTKSSSFYEDIHDLFFLRNAVSHLKFSNFSEREADIVYEAAIGGKKVIFYILLELQSAVDYRIPYRLLLYIIEILRHYYNHADAKERKRKEFKFPVIFPIVFFSGSATWTIPLNIREMFAEPERLGR